ncbi:polysaccharide pyruvyl transferase family protein [Pseudoroseomonas cervicalis]|uniref:polysaccharide pyruvyl transferase family protein n=1 Tax=Teichococcus cervicalis TaxID=204525 RepID=UPI0022F15FF3|nr:polysaccharide pyruvyl transferase family protein [Pseudoroseomonas cervicalis]WBV44033.1 polysaccharide pyruvyl transferase family protein [Pseudoroseomonas cervicalis]
MPAEAPAAGPPAPAGPVALFGTFDVANYGDLLFPHLAAHLLRLEAGALRCYAPRGGAPGWAECWPARPLAGFATDPAPALCLVGGGNIIHANPTPLPDYAGLFGRSDFVYAALWLGAAILAARAGARLAWNAPGLPTPVEGGWARALRDLALPAAEHLALRDAASQVFLGAPDHPAGLVPDTALALSDAWPAGPLRPLAEAAFAARGLAVPQRWVAIHLNDRYIGGDLPGACAAIGRIAQALGAVPVLLAIGPCHGDDALARQAAALLDGPVLLADRPQGLREIAALIAHATAYAGSSLHGLITALSYGRPGLVVARPRMVKFLGFLEPLGEAARLQESWAEAAAAAPALLRPLPPPALARLAAARARIAAHAATLRGVLAAPPRPAAAAARARLLAAVTAPEARPEWAQLHRALLAEETPPDDPEAWAAALAQALRGPPDAALRRRIAEARARWPHHLRLALLETEWLERAGQAGEARQRLAVLQERHPDNPWPAVRLVRLLAREGEAEAARALYRQRLQQAALPPGLHQELTRLWDGAAGEAAPA